MAGREGPGLLARGRRLTDDEADLVLASPEGQRIESMVTYSAVGRPDEVKDYLDGFAKHADADELIVALQSPTVEERLRSTSWRLTGPRRHVRSPGLTGRVATSVESRSSRRPKERS